MGERSLVEVANLHRRYGDVHAVQGLNFRLERGEVLFIDEIHRLNPVVEEILYPAMEDFQLDIVIGEGPAARSIKLDLPPFTLVGATTRAGLLTSPLRDRFGIVQRLEFYDYQDLCRIVETHRVASDAGTWIDARYEDIIREPREGLRRLAEFLGPPAEEPYLDACAALVRAPRLSRHEHEWSAEQIERTGEAIESFEFLRGYTFAD